MNFIKAINEFNYNAGLLDAGYIDEKECAFPIEEMLEALNTSNLADTLGSPNASPKMLSRRIMSLVSAPMDIKYIDRVDKHLDAIVYSFGSLFKLGLTVKEVELALDIVMEANMTKLNAGQDTEGKQLKPENFVSPEDKIMRMLGYE